MIQTPRYLSMFNKTWYLAGMLIVYVVAISPTSSTSLDIKTIVEDASLREIPELRNQNESRLE